MEDAIQDSTDADTDTRSAPLAARLARAIWREEIRDQGLSKDERQARWKEVRKDRVRAARRLIRRLQGAGLSLVETAPADDAQT